MWRECYLCVTKKFLAAGIPQKELFQDDKIHLSAKGNEVLANAIKNYLMKIIFKCVS